MSPPRLAVVGGGIVGLAYALGGVGRGCRVTVFERSPSAMGASIRNFGMIWPIGQTLTPAHPVAVASRGIWERLAMEAGFWFRPRGSLHVAHADDEWAVLREFHGQAIREGIPCRLLDAEETVRISPIANPSGLRGALHSPTEAGVNPRRAVAAIAAHLRDRRGVDIRFGATVVGVRGGRLRTNDGDEHHFDRIVVCGGSDVETLFPRFLARHGVRRCKLQMLATPPRAFPGGIGPFLAGGLTLRHYGNFTAAPTLPAVRERVARTAPELDDLGIHVMVAENEDGSLVLGDSHEYDDDIAPFDKQEIDDLILRELRRIAVLPDWSIAERWHGVYAKHPSLPIVRADPEPGLHVRTGTGGAGMTLSFGLAEEDWRKWEEGATP